MSSEKSCLRQDLSLHEKIALLYEMKKQPEGTSLRKLEKFWKFRNSQSHIYELLKNRFEKNGAA